MLPDSVFIVLAHATRGRFKFFYLVRRSFRSLVRSFIRFYLAAREALRIDFCCSAPDTNRSDTNRLAVRTTTQSMSSEEAKQLAFCQGRSLDRLGSVLSCLTLFSVRVRSPHFERRERQIDCRVARALGREHRRRTNPTKLNETNERSEILRRSVARMSVRELHDPPVEHCCSVYETYNEHALNFDVVVRLVRVRVRNPNSRSNHKRASTNDNYDLSIDQAAAVASFEWPRE